MDPRGQVSWLRLAQVPTAADAAEAFEDDGAGTTPIEDPDTFGLKAGELVLVNKILNNEEFTNFVEQLGTSNPQAATSAKQRFEELAEAERTRIMGEAPELLDAMTQIPTVVPATFRDTQFEEFFRNLADIRDQEDVNQAAGAAANAINDAGLFASLMVRFKALYEQLQNEMIGAYAPAGGAPQTGPTASSWRRVTKTAQPSMVPEPVVEPLVEAPQQTPLEAEAYQSLEELMGALVRMGPYQDTYNRILEQINDDDQDSAKAALSAFFQGFPEGLCTLYGIMVKAGMAEPIDQGIVERIMEQHPQLGQKDEENGKIASNGSTPGLWLPPANSGLYSTSEADEKMEKTASGGIGGAGPHYYTHGPGENRYCPKLRNMVNTFVCRYHCLDGLPIDDHQILCGEAIWRQAVMDKFSREYKDADGNWVGGYLNKRFEIERNTAEHPYQLKPNQRQAPINEDAWSPEKRLQELRRSESSKRSYSETPGDPKGLYNWDPYQAAGTPKNPQVFEKKKDPIAKIASSQAGSKVAFIAGDATMKECMEQKTFLGFKEDEAKQSCNKEFAEWANLQNQPGSDPNAPRVTQPTASWTRGTEKVAMEPGLPEDPMVPQVPSWLHVDSENYGDAAEGLYWFAANNHEGQTSTLYSILSTLGYKPGPMQNAPGESGQIFYDALAEGTLDPEKLAHDIDNVYSASHEDETEQAMYASSSWLSKNAANLPNAGKRCNGCGKNLGPTAFACDQCGSRDLAATSAEQEASRSGVVTKEKNNLQAPMMASQLPTGIWRVTADGRNFYGDTKKEAQGKARGLADLEPGTVQDQKALIQKEIQKEPRPVSTGEPWVPTPARPRRKTPQQLSQERIGDPTPTTPPIKRPMGQPRTEIQGGESEFASAGHVGSAEIETAAATEVADKDPRDQRTFEESHQDSKVIGPDPRTRKV